MEQHPIPQQISSYQFRLVGDMTLKQFFQLASGILIALLFYASPLHGLIKWPLVILFSMFGAALAFLPFEDRSLDKWIVAFFKSVYSPTIYLWQKTTTQAFFQEEAKAPIENFAAPGGEKELASYLESRTSTQTKSSSKLEEIEKTLLSKFASLMGSGQRKESQVIVAPQPILQTSQPATPEPQATAQKPGETGDLKIPSMDTVRVVAGQNETRPKIVVEEKGGLIEKPIVPFEAPKKVEQTGPLKEAQFSQEAGPPAPPQKANTVTGQVMDASGKIVEAAILEIKDAAGRPVRAVRTNKVGHFIIVTPLQNGEYEIITEKDGLTFDSVGFEAKGDMIPPIAIRANNSMEQTN